MRSLAARVNPSDNIILVGHSSGAQAALRYCEEYPCKAVVLVAATYSDLGDAGERASGYYPQGDTNPYKFEDMKTNCPVWYQFHSDDDPFIPLQEAGQIRDGLGLTDTYLMLPGRSHFFEPFPELLEVLEKLC
jgi:predicted alpha/beta hydrolase family esterase